MNKDKCMHHLLYGTFIFIGICMWIMFAIVFKNDLEMFNARMAYGIAPPNDQILFDSISLMLQSIILTMPLLTIAYAISINISKQKKEIKLTEESE